MDTRPITTHLPENLVEKLDGLSRRMDRSRDWIVKEAITAFILREEKRHRLTLEALRDVDAGRTVNYAEVEAWAKSLPGTKRCVRR